MTHSANIYVKEKLKKFIYNFINKFKIKMYDKLTKINFKLELNKLILPKFIKLNSLYFI